MAKVRITKALVKQIEKVFSKEEGNEIIDLLYTLETNPHKGKAMGHVSNILIKEVKYKKYRFCCITDGHVLKFGTEEELQFLIIKFIRMSEKKDQKQIIEEMKDALKAWGLS